MVQPYQKLPKTKPLDPTTFTLPFPPFYQSVVLCLPLLRLLAGGMAGRLGRGFVDIFILSSLRF